MEEEIKNFLMVLKPLQNINSEFPLQYVTCLCHIALNQGLCITDLAQKTGMALSTVSRITTALSKTDGTYELVRIEIAPYEKRRKCIYLTNKGLTLMKEIIETPMTQS